MALTQATKTRTVTSAAVYLRISDDRGGTEFGVKRQEKLCHAVAKAKGWPVGETYTDNDRSATTGVPRPEYERMLAAVEAGAHDAIVAVDMDRLLRTQKDSVRLREITEAHGVPIALHSGEIDTTTADGILRLSILVGVAEFEGHKKSERMRREAEQAARRGVARGPHRPFGYKADRVTIDAKEAKLVREMFDRVMLGESCTAIATDFNARSVPTPQGAPGWGGATIGAVLKNPRIYGGRAYKGEVLNEKAWKGIITRPEWDRVNAKLRRQSTPGRRPSRLLVSLARCGLCGGPLHQSTQIRNGTPSTRYLCHKKPGAPGCGRIAINADMLDELVSEAVVMRLASPAVLRELRRKPKKGRKDDDLDLAQIEKDLVDLADDHGAGRIARAEWMAARSGLEERRAKAQRALEADTDTGPLAPFVGADVQTLWAAADVTRQRGVLEAMIEAITVKPASPGVNKFDAGRVEVVWRV